MMIFLLFIILVIIYYMNLKIYIKIDNRRHLPKAKKIKKEYKKEEIIVRDKKLNLWHKLKKIVNIYMNWMEGIIRVALLILMYIPSHHIRKFFLKYMYGMKIGKNVVIYYGAEIRAPWRIHIGDGTIIGDKTILDGRSGIKIGKNVNFSTGAWIWTEQHNVNSPTFSTEDACGMVEIGDRSWISSRTVILPGVTIGEGTVIAAGGVVTKSCDSFSIYGGVPAKKIGCRNRDLSYAFSGAHLHFL